MTKKFNQDQSIALCHLISSIGHRGLASIDDCINRLTKVQISCTHTDAPLGIRLEGIQIVALQAIDDSYGISGWDLLSAAISLEGLNISSRMTGHGFRYTDMLEKFATALGVEKQLRSDGS